jgi:retinol dehydrogenase 12
MWRFYDLKNIFKLAGTGVVTFSVHPGVVQTELGRHLHETSSFADGATKFLGRYFFKTAEMGAQTSVYCATEESILKYSGCYFRSVGI